ncbi:MAG: trigger factor [Candidatus Eisenbacteria sp.]|nr:trigger factor [Candidatus Eisenbacteria bacterium]
MKVEVREPGPLRKELEIQLDVEEVNAFIDELIGAFRRRHAFPGFRPGKVPDQVVRVRFHEEIERALLTELVPRSIDRALGEQGVHPAAPGDLSAIRYQAGEPLSFTVAFSVWPEVELVPYEGMEVEQRTEEVTPEEIEAFLGQIRERAAEAVPVERPAQVGDLLSAELDSIDAQGQRLKGTRREKVTLEVGAPTLLPEFREAADGIRPSEARELSVTYPKDYGEESLRGATRRYRLRAVQIQEKKLPPLDDSLAQRLDANLDLEGLRARVRLRLESEKRFAARERLEEEIVERLIAANAFDLPAAAIDGAVERLLKQLAEQNSELDREAAAKAYRPRVERIQRRDFLLSKVAEREGVRVTEAEVEGEVARRAREERRSVEEVRKDLGDLDRFRQFLFERKVFDALVGKVKVREVRTAPTPPEAPVTVAPAGEEETPPPAEKP